MGLSYDPIGSLGKRDLILSLAGLLEAGETISTVTATSNDPTLLAVTGEAANAAAVDQDGITAEIGESITFSVECLVDGTNEIASIEFDFTGTAGTEDRVTPAVPIVPTLND